MTIGVIVPCRNGATTIAATIRSLLGQEEVDLRIIVVANNCDDDTAAIARTFEPMGVRVLEMPVNKRKKAGALNYAWPLVSDCEFVFTMDDDTVLQPKTIIQLKTELVKDPKLGGVCARYWAQRTNGLVPRLQGLEYARFDDMKEIKKRRVTVLSGAAVLYRTTALMDVLKYQGTGAPWDPSSLIEDYRLTLVLKTHDWDVRVARFPAVFTATPQTFRELWNQRKRWNRGGIEEVLKLGWCKATKEDVVAYGLFLLSQMMRLLWIITLVGSMACGISYSFALVWLVFPALVLLDRATAMWRMPQTDWRDHAITWSLLLEDFYGMMLEVNLLKSAFDVIARRPRPW